jgi:hypothetical protein
VLGQCSSQPPSTGDDNQVQILLEDYALHAILNTVTCDFLRTHFLLFQF